MSPSSQFCNREVSQVKKCLIAMSGGVDSSAAARVMQERGYECLGCTMTLCGHEAADDAAAVAKQLGMEFHLLHAEEAFRRHVVADFVRCYEQGRTPNPCAVCNKHLKFGVLLEKAEALGCGCIATGHYARIGQKENGEFSLKKAADAAKDQSYFLWQLDKKQLSRVVFPLGDRVKAEARELAAENALSTAGKKDSQDICFVPDGDYAGFLQAFTGKTYPQGLFLLTDGTVLGQHKGIIHYTVGQRRGLGIAWEHPLYVVRIDAENNAVILGKNEELFTASVTAEQVNLLEELPARCKAKIRSRHAEQPCSVRYEDGKLHVLFDEPQRAPTPGQSLVLYDGDTVLGGGIIV